MQQLNAACMSAVFNFSPVMRFVARPGGAWRGGAGRGGAGHGGQAAKGVFDTASVAGIFVIDERNKLRPRDGT